MGIQEPHLDEPRTRLHRTPHPRPTARASQAPPRPPHAAEQLSPDDHQGEHRRDLTAPARVVEHGRRVVDAEHGPRRVLRAGGRAGRRAPEPRQRCTLGQAAAGAGGRGELRAQWRGRSAHRGARRPPLRRAAVTEARHLLSWRERDVATTVNVGHAHRVETGGAREPRDIGRGRDQTDIWGTLRRLKDAAAARGADLAAAATLMLDHALERAGARSTSQPGRGEPAAHLKRRKISYEPRRRARQPRRARVNPKGKIERPMPMWRR